MKFPLILLILLFAPLGVLFSQQSYDSAVEAYRNRNLDEALNYIESAAQESPGNDSIWLLKGLIYQLKGELQMAEEAWLHGKSMMGKEYNSIILHLGNLYIVKNELSSAVENYSLLVNTALESKARLNRANCYVTLQKYPEAVNDYQAYLQLAPDSDKRSDVEAIIELLLKEQGRQEELARLDEERRLEEERLRLEEEARQQALLDEILASLEDAGDESQALRGEDEKLEMDSDDSDILE